MTAGQGLSPTLPCGLRGNVQNVLSLKVSRLYDVFVAFWTDINSKGDSAPRL